MLESYLNQKKLFEFEPVETEWVFNKNIIICAFTCDGCKTLLFDEYLDIIKPFLKNVIIEIKRLVDGKTQLSINIAFRSSKDINENLDKHSLSDNKEIVMSQEPDVITEELFKTLRTNHPETLEMKMKGSDFVFDYVDKLSYSCHKIRVNFGGSYINSPDSLQNKKATINYINECGDKYFQYAAAVTLNQKEIGKNSQRISKIEALIGIYYPSKKKKNTGKVIKQLVLMFYIPILKKYILSTFQNTTQSVKNKLFS